MKLRAIGLGLAISIPLAKAYTGDLTHYTPGGTGSCGDAINDGDALVALSTDIMSLTNSGNPNANPLCGKQITIHNPTTGTNTVATVKDTCMGCAFGSIDVMPQLFSIIAPEGNGRVHGIEWTPIGWTVPGGSAESASGSTAPQSSASPAVQPSSSAAAAAIPSATLPTVPAQEKVAAIAPSESSSPPAAPSATPAVSPAVSSSAGQQTSPAPAASTAPCATAGQTICSADGTQVGTCTLELRVEMGPVAQGTKCVGGYMVMANSRLRSRRRG